MVRFQSSSFVFTVLVALLLASLAASPALSQAPFYQGKTITLIVGAGPGGMGDLRAKALASVLAKNIPGNPSITFQYMAGAGGRRAANHLYNTARPDGLTLYRISSSIVSYAVLGETGVQYDVDKLIYLGTTEHQLYYVFMTRAALGHDSLTKLRPAAGLRIGSAPVGHTGYLHSRMIAYFLDLANSRIIPGYENEDLDVAFARGEVDAQVASMGTISQHDFLKNKAVHFHAGIEYPRGWKDPRFSHLNLPDLESFAKTESEKKLLAMMRNLRSVGTALLFPPGRAEGSGGYSEGSRAQDPHRSGVHRRVPQTHQRRHSDAADARRAGESCTGHSARRGNDRAVQKIRWNRRIAAAPVGGAFALI